MILGRSTPQWVAMITSAGGLAQLLIVQFVENVDAIAVGTVVGAIVLFLGGFLAFLANTATTPVGDPRLKSGAVVSVLDVMGKLTGDKVRIEETPPGPAGIDAQAPRG